LTKVRSTHAGTTPLARNIRRMKTRHSGGSDDFSDLEPARL
jgi:hypothetical protein